MQNIFAKIENSFYLAMEGKEDVKKLIWCWGVPSYLISFFILDHIIRLQGMRILDIAISAMATIFFVWHIYVLKKCSPEKPKLTPEEKKLKRLEARRNFMRSFFRKLFLKEPITKWDPVFVTIVIDLLCIATFTGYILN